MIVALAGIGTAVALYPVVKRPERRGRSGFVGTRTLEGAPSSLAWRASCRS